MTVKIIMMLMTMIIKTLLLVVKHPTQTVFNLIKYYFYEQ